MQAWQIEKATIIWSGLGLVSSRWRGILKIISFFLSPATDSRLISMVAMPSLGLPEQPISEPQPVLVSGCGFCLQTVLQMLLWQAGTGREDFSLYYGYFFFSGPRKSVQMQ